jgi:hypothetical protein
MATAELPQAILDNIICPISLQPMTNPVVHSPCGKSFDSTSIASLQQYAGTGHSLCPLCREPMIDKINLHQNRALRDLVEALISPKHAGLLAAAAPPASKITSALNIATYRSSIQPDGNEYAYIHINPIYTGELAAQPTHFILVVDISGSMAEYVRINKGAGTMESNGLTRIDLVSHMANTFLHSLSVDDRMSLVTFSDAAHVIFENEQYADSLEARMKRALVASGNTNLWGGIAAGIKIAEGSHHINTAIIVFTDGLPNIGPAMSADYERIMRDIIGIRIGKYAIHTMGFTNSVNSDILYNIAMYGHGTFNFIPDTSFIGTIAVNAITNIKMTCITGMTITVHTGGLSTHIIKCGPLLIAHDRWFSFPLHNFLGIEVRYNGCKGAIRIHRAEVETSGAPPAQNMVETYYRYQICNLLKITQIDAKPHDTAAQLASIMPKLTHLARRLQHDYSISKYAYLNDLYLELAGEITMALNPAYYMQWGIHYLRSLQHSHGTQLTNNFKDYAVQHYGAAKYKTLRDSINDIFNGLPAPQVAPESIHMATHGVITDMSRYNSTSNGCFAHDSIVFTSKDPFAIIPYPTEVSKIRVGDYIATSGIGGNMARVTHITVAKNGAPFEVVKFADSGLIITPWHPVKMHPLARWEFPANIAATHPECASLMMYDEDVYDIAVEDADYAYVQNMTVITLGHQVRGDRVASHAYFGSEYVLHDLTKFNKDAAGRCVIFPHNIVRHVETNVIIGFRP